MVQAECFGYKNIKGHEGCTALNRLYCKEEKCRFYKNKKEINLREIERSIRSYSI